MDVRGVVSMIARMQGDALAEEFFYRGDER